MMFEEAFRNCQKKKEFPLQTRILNALFSSTDQEVDPLENLQGSIGICGEQFLDIHAQEPWPQLIKLYQPYEVEQILLPDNANCLAVQAYLKMCNLEFQIEPRSNAEYMSPSGRVPFIQCGAFVVSDFDGIVNFVNTKGTSLSEELEATDKADMRAYISLVNNVLVNAEQYICWCDPTTLNNITKPRYGSVYPWPLNHILNWQKQSQVTKKLKVLGWYNKTLTEVLGEVKNCCEALSERLENKKYFFGESPTELDALVYGHVKALTTTRLLSSTACISNIISQFPLIMEHNQLVHCRYFDSDLKPSSEDFEVIEKISEVSWQLSESVESISPFHEGPFCCSPDSTFDKTSLSDSDISFEYNF